MLHPHSRVLFLSPLLRVCVWSFVTFVPRNPHRAMRTHKRVLSRYLLFADSVLSGKRDAFADKAMSGADLAALLREHLHVRRCCMFLDLNHQHGIWRDVDGKKKLHFGFSELRRGVHKSFMPTLERLLSAKEQRLAWEDMLRKSKREWEKEVRRLLFTGLGVRRCLVVFVVVPGAGGVTCAVPLLLLPPRRLGLPSNSTALSPHTHPVCRSRRAYYGLAGF